MKLIQVASFERQMNEEERRTYDSLLATHSIVINKYIEIIHNEDQNNITWVNKREKAYKALKDIDDKLSKFKSKFIKKENQQSKEWQEIEKEMREREQKTLEMAKNNSSFQRKIERAIDNWPRTIDPETAGYILRNGEMLNFSYDGRTRGMDHRYITEDIDELDSGTIGMKQFQFATGSVRMQLNNLGVNFDCVVKPTFSQRLKMIEIAEGKLIILEIEGKNYEFDDIGEMVEEMRWY